MLTLETIVVRGTVCGREMAVSTTGPAPALRAASLFDIDAELAERLDPRQRAEARARAIVPVVDLTAGPWSPTRLDTGASRPFALLVVDGLVVRELLLAGSTASELLGPGDVVALAPSDDALLPATAEWSVPQAARVAILDDRLTPILRVWPGVGTVLLDRATRREVRLSMHRAIAQLPRVDQRLLAFFAHLAERWGRVAATGVVLPIQLTHETLGRLIGARRPTVSLALKDLASDGLLRRREDGAWLLGYEAFDRLGAESAIPAGWQPADARPLAELDGGDGATSPREAPRRLTPEDITALRERIERLRTTHDERMAHAVTVLQRSRETRLAILRERELPTGW
jgi:CRP/FNR family transcriptional regulator, cyclic AMP receptor protein